MRVLVADASAAQRTVLRLALDGWGFEIRSDVGDARAAVEAAERFRPDVCLLGLDLTGDALGAVADIASSVPVVVLADSVDEDELLAYLRAGASGYLLKDIDTRRLPAILKRVGEGEAVLPRALVAPLIRELRELEGRARFAHRLTAREYEVLELLREGLTTADVAEHLFVAPVTVRTHVAAILKKLGVPDRPAAIRVLEDAEAPPRRR